MRDKVLEFRKKNGLSQEKFAKMCGISALTVIRIESGGKPSVIVEGKILKVIENGGK